jgi:cytochrome P450
MPITAVDLDPFADEFIRDPYPHYRVMRDAGPVFRLERYDVLATARFDGVKTTMREHTVFRSAEGPGFNEPYNQKMKGTVVASEPPEHAEIRATMVRRLRLARLKDMQPVADTLAHKLVVEFLERGCFDAATDLARPFVSAFVGSVLGISHEIAELAIDGSTEGFNSTGPLNERTIAAKPVIDRLFTVMSQLTKHDFAADTIGWDILDAHERGEIPFASSLSLLFNFLGPAFDTTINTMGATLWLLAEHPDQWAALREDPGLISSAINESLRIESPLQAWSRWCPDGATLDGEVIPPGTRVAVFPGAANRDERHYPDPDRFDVRRNPVDHLAFGQGIHMCVGAPLARMELTSTLTALTALAHVIEPTAAPTVRLNNTTRGFTSVPLRIA